MIMQRRERVAHTPELDRPQREPAPQTPRRAARLDDFAISLRATPLQLERFELALLSAQAAVHRATQMHRVAARGVRGPGGSLPHLDVIQQAFGHHDVSGVQAHVGPQAREACGELGAHGYASGNDVAFAGPPSLHTAAHEAAHVVQQRGQVQLAGGVGQAGDRYEQHADAVADAVVSGRSAQALLDGFAGPGGAPGVQRAALQLDGEQGGSSGGAAAPAAGAQETNAAPQNGHAASERYQAMPIRMVVALEANAPTEAQHAALQILDRNASGPWAHLDWSSVQRGAALRLFHPDRIQQGDSWGCGPASTLNAMATAQPPQYAYLVWQCFARGVVNGRRVRDELLNNRPPADNSIPDVDWMTMFGMRDVANAVQAASGNPDEHFEQITSQGEMASWLTEYLHCVETRQVNSLLVGAAEGGFFVSRILSTHPNAVFCYMNVNAEHLQRREGNPFPNHWIRLLGPIQMRDDRMIFDAFTWGANRHYELTRTEFQNATAYFVLGSRRAGILGAGQRRQGQGSQPLLGI